MDLSKEGRKRVIRIIILMPLIGGIIGLFFGLLIYWVLSLLVSIPHIVKEAMIYGMAVLMFLSGVSFSCRYYRVLKK